MTALLAAAESACCAQFNCNDGGRPCRKLKLASILHHQLPTGGSSTICRTTCDFVAGQVEVTLVLLTSCKPNDGITSLTGLIVSLSICIIIVRIRIAEVVMASPMRSPQAGVLGDLPNDFRCPLSGDIMTDPVR